VLVGVDLCQEGTAMETAAPARTVWTRLWIIWAACGLGSALAIIGALELGWQAPPHIWLWWAIPGVVYGGALEIAALVSPGTGDTLSEHVWQMPVGWRSLISVYCLWGAWWLATGSAWPSVLIAFLLWCAWHFSFEVPEEGL
jgi:hypothetical protein